MAGPTITGVSNVAFDENVANNGLQVISANVTLADAEGDFNGGVLTISGLLAEDLVGIAGNANVYLSGSTVYYDADGAGGAAAVAVGTAAGGHGAAFKVTFNSNATTAIVEAVIERVGYANTSDTPTATRDLTISVVDGAGHDSLAPVWGEPSSLLGQFASRTSYVTLGDTNGDGLPDIFLGFGGGHLVTQINYVTWTTSGGTVPGVQVSSNAAPAAGDLNSDGLLDLVVGGGDGRLKVYYGSAAGFVEQSGHFLATIDIGDNAKPALGDVDGDGDLDIAIGGSNNEVEFYRNDGATWVNALTYTTATGNETAPALGDFDGDGDVDLLAGEDNGTFTLGFLNGWNPAGFTYIQNYQGWDTGVGSGAALGDYDGDGDMDALIVGYSGWYTVQKVENIASRDFTVTVNAQADGTAMATGAPTLNGVATSVTFLENTVNATPQFLDADVTFGDPDFGGGTITVSGLLAEDVVSIGNTGWIALSGGELFYDDDGDGEGASILIGTVTGGNGATLTISLNDVGPEIVERVLEALTYANTSNTPTASRDLTIDVRDASGLAVVGGFEFGGAGGTSAPGNTGVILFDYDNDGELDVFHGRADGTIVGGGSFSGAPVPIGASPFWGIDVGDNAAPAMADVDGDGDQDLVVGRGDGTLAYFRNMGGSFVEVVGSHPFSGIDAGADSRPVFGDIDNDGDLDLFVTGDAAGERTRVYLNQGGVFTHYTTFANAGVNSFADIDGDGNVELIQSASGGVVAYEVTFAAPGVLGFTSVDPRGLTGVEIANAQLAFGDLDGDGDVDAYFVESGRIGFVLNGVTPGRTITINVTAEADPIVGTNAGETLWGTPEEDIIRGLGGNDIIHALASDDYVEGGAGNDTVYGDEGDDELRGEAGNDILDGGVGDDLLIGGLGNDTYVVDSANDLIVEQAGEGTDTVKSSTNYALGANVENLILTGATGLTGAGNSLANVITGSGGDDILHGLGGNDTISGGLGGDWIQGGEGVDKLYGEDGADTLVGEAGNDVLAGGAGADTVNGGDGVDSIDGGDDDDFLYGEAGADTIVGGAGADRIQGGAGRDVLTGGAGGDTFVFTNHDMVSSKAGGVAELDKILDFKPSEGDVIDLSGIDANINLAGDQAFTWATGNVFHKVAGEAVMKFVAGKATLQLDVDGDGKADFQLEIGGAATGISDNNEGRGGGGGGALHPTVGWVM